MGTPISSNAAKTIGVVVVDDSPSIRQLLATIINEQPDMTVLAMASDPFNARRVIRETNPDVVTLDVEMPHMNGLEFLERIMRLRPMPVIMLSSLTTNGAEITLQALELGAVDFIAKPSYLERDGGERLARELVAKIRVAARARVKRRVAVERPARGKGAPTGGVIALGASTGGTQALASIMQVLPRDCPPVLVVQHLPAPFTTAFARHLDAITEMTVVEGEDNLPVTRGMAIVAPAGRHMMLDRSVQGLRVLLSDDPPVCFSRPSVDVLFLSIARARLGAVRAALLTGMGRDGAQGLLALRRGGARTFAQDEESSVVYGMPGAAVLLGAAEQVVPISELPYLLLT